MPNILCPQLPKAAAPIDGEHKLTIPYKTVTLIDLCPRDGALRHRHLVLYLFISVQVELPISLWPKGSFYVLIILIVHSGVTYLTLLYSSKLNEDQVEGALSSVQYIGHVMARKWTEKWTPRGADQKFWVSRRDRTSWRGTSLNTMPLQHCHNIARNVAKLGQTICVLEMSFI